MDGIGNSCVVVEIVNNQSSLGAAKTNPVGSQQVTVIVHFQSVKNSGRAVLQFMEQSVLAFNITTVDFTTGHIHTHTDGIEDARFFIIGDAVGSRYTS